MRQGVVLGHTDPKTIEKGPTEPVQVKDLYATVLYSLGIAYDKEVITPIGRPMSFSAGKPIERLLAMG